jgi:hypothetical protein
MEDKSQKQSMLHKKGTGRNEERKHKMITMPSSAMLRRTDVLDKPDASIIRVTRIGELETTLAVSVLGCYLLRTLFPLH